MEEQILDQRYRKKIIDEIKGNENVQRKIKSYKKHNMQQDNFYQYVKEHLEAKLDPETVCEMDIFASVNLQKRISTAQGAIYRKEPTRKVFNTSGDDVEEFEEVFDDIDLNTKLRRANVDYKYQDQCKVQYYVDEQKIKARVLLPYQYDVVPHQNNPEKELFTIISNFDNTHRDRIREEKNSNGFSQGDTYRDSINQEIADYDDQSLREERFYWWSKSYNVVTNGKGEVLDKVTEEVLEEIEDRDVLSPYRDYGCVPFVEVSGPKNFEYWCRSGDVLFDTTVLYNVTLTSEKEVVDLQGHSQAYYKGDVENMPKHFRVGPSKILFIPINPNQPVDAEFGFANPGSDLAGIREFRESFLRAFLTSIGLDVSIVSGDSSVQGASSGVEKMLQMIEKFEASQDDISLFKNVERQSFKVICAIIKTYAGARDENGDLFLSDKYQISITDDLDFMVEFNKPEMTMTYDERIDVATKEIEAGLSSRVHAVMELKDMTKEQAIEYIKEVDEFEGLNGTQDIQEQDRTAFQSSEAFGLRPE